MKILMISDIHYRTKLYHGIDKSKRFEWLYSVINKESPELLIFTGDFGEKATHELFQCLP